MEKYSDRPQYDRDRARKLATAGSSRGKRAWEPPIRYVIAYPWGFHNRQQRRANDRESRLRQNKRRRNVARIWHDKHGTNPRPRRRTNGTPPQPRRRS